MSDQRRARCREPIRVLLVDDSQDDRQLIGDLLDDISDTRYSIDWVQDLASGHDRIDQGGFDVCLLDHRFPEGDGLDILEAAIARGLTPPFIVLTGHGSVALDHRAMTIGAAGFLDKNRLDPITLERTIRYAIRHQKMMTGLARATLRDETTGLVNRVLFRDRLAHALAAARRHDRQVAVMLIDLTFETEMIADDDRTEAWLAIAGQRLVDDLRETDTVARFASRQCALILEGLKTAEQVDVIAKKVLKRLSSPIIEDGSTVAPRPSIGIALYPKEGGDVAGLMRQAEAAMRRAKGEGGCRYAFGSEQVDRRVRHDLVRDKLMARIIERGELAFHFRPQIDLTSDVIGFSAEIVGNRLDNETLSVEQLLPVLADRRHMEALCDWMLSASVAQLMRWREHGFERIDLTLPFPSRRASDLQALDVALHRHLVDAEIGAERIEFDLDEDLVIGDLASGGLRLSALKARGVRLALDGFGRVETGIHGLAGELLDSLKLSPRLYRDLPGEASRETLVRAIIGLGHDLELRVVANGVRDDRQFAFLKQSGCDAVQLRASCPLLSPEAATGWLHQVRQDRREKGWRRRAKLTAEQQTMTTAPP